MIFLHGLNIAKSHKEPAQSEQTHFRGLWGTTPIGRLPNESIAEQVD
jgi:hypothetical protein